MEIVPLGPGFAAELRGVMLAEIAAPPTLRTRRRAPRSRSIRSSSSAART